MKFGTLLLVVLFVSASHGFDWKAKLKKMIGSNSSVGKFITKAHKMLKYTLGGRTERTDGKPWFCHSLDCPAFKTIKTEEDYEERCYEETTWVATGTTGPHVGKETSLKGMFKILFSYITGANMDGVQIKMTAPVLTTMKMDKTKKNTLDFMMHFYVSKDVKDIPAPTNKDVKIVKLPAMCVFVRSFEGWVTSADKNLKKEMLALQKTLDNAGEKYDKSVLFTAGYDSPWRFFYRHNEVMFMKTTKENSDPAVDIAE